jgi:hypothetical protein
VTDAVTNWMNAGMPVKKRPACEAGTLEPTGRRGGRPYGAPTEPAQPIELAN